MAKTGARFYRGNFGGVHCDIGDFSNDCGMQGTAKMVLQTKGNGAAAIGYGGSFFRPTGGARAKSGRRLTHGDSGSGHFAPEDDFSAAN